MAGNCSKCMEVLPQDAKNRCCCDGCNNLLCKKCSQLSATEIKVTELSQRRMIFFCSECKANYQEFLQMKTYLKTEMDKQVSLIRSEFSLFFEELGNKLSVIERQNELQVNRIYKNINENYSQHQNAIKALSTSINKHEINKKSPENLLCAPETYSNAVRNKSNGLNKEKNIPNHKNNSQKVFLPQEKNYNHFQALSKTQEKVMDEIINLEDACDPISNPTSPRLPSRNDGFLPFRRNRKSGKVGTADIVSSVNDTFEGSANSQKKLWIFIKKVKDNATSEKIKDYLSLTLKTDAENISVKKVDTYYQTKDNNCFLIGVNSVYKNVIYNDSFWPKGVMYQRFDFIRGEKFLDNPKFKNNLNKKTQLQSPREESVTGPTSFHVTKNS